MTTTEPATIATVAMTTRQIAETAWDSGGTLAHVVHMPTILARRNDKVARAAERTGTP